MAHQIGFRSLSLILDTMIEDFTLAQHASACCAEEEAELLAYAESALLLEGDLTERETRLTDPFSVSLGELHYLHL
jgi:hypothetical protein